ncbi:uncharacterized protein L969DRAFT_85035 [Mixia osmundae IAM 14324]|uniref:uncharacterized protein n=1 Tax=Mixia osmundae (strain CBS 9802 / IAM 14324 / JCM 22182 / KY 12970) TaxID=764103 RepID=UPI0004A5569A|nr:uncharacterized protein L969DRAFT_85035 [Mixia osmundae IAM 14324]KEI41264.1 hypothetical protein L969DRAFT_85035 [Mixia osmundae IAM 14324]
MSFVRLLILSMSMLIGTLGIGSIPLAFQLSPRRLRALSIFGVGLLVGAALTVIIPEGIEALANGTESMHDHSDIVHGDHEHGAMDQGRYIGISMLAGFMVMLFIEQLTSHSHPVPVAPHRKAVQELPLHRTTSRSNFRKSAEYATLNSPTRINVEDASDEEQLTEEANTSRHPLLANGLKATARPARIQNLGHARDGSLSHIHGDNTARSLSTTIGLIVHSVADGISLGASASATAAGKQAGEHAETSLDIIIFVAIMVHKAPAAFGLVSVLLSDGLSKPNIRRALSGFAAAAPLGAILTYTLLALLATDSQGLQWWTGIALLFSGGTFLFVATHVMQDAEQEGEGGVQEIEKLERLGYMSVGMLAPVILQSIFGHGH